MKNLATLFFFFLLCSTAAQAQLTFTSADYLGFFQSVGTPTSYQAVDASQFASLITTTGANQTWDFSGKTYTQEATGAGISLISPSQAPLHSDPDFSSATHVLKLLMPHGDTSAYEYVIIDGNGVGELGMAIGVGATVTKVLTYSPALQIEKFPMTYQTSWQSTSTETLVAAGFTAAVTNNVTVDGYGSLQVPGSGTIQTLRKKTALSQTVFGTTTTTYTYSWTTKAGYSASVSAGSSQTPTSASYSNPQNVAEVHGANTDEFSLRLTANPASTGETQLLYTIPKDEPVQVAVMDELGRNVRMLQNGFAPAGQNSIAIDPGSLEAGTYFVRLSADGMSAMQKLIIQ